MARIITLHGQRLKSGIFACLLVCRVATRETNRQTEREKERKKDRQTDRQTDVFLSDDPHVRVESESCITSLDRKRIW